MWPSDVLPRRSQALAGALAALVAAGGGRLAVVADDGAGADGPGARMWSAVEAGWR